MAEPNVLDVLHEPGAMPDLEVVPAGGRWLVELVGGNDALSVHDSLQAAVDAGRSIARARAVDLVIHDGPGEPRVERFSVERRAN